VFPPIPKSHFSALLKHRARVSRANAIPNAAILSTFQKEPMSLELPGEAQNQVFRPPSSLPPLSSGLAFRKTGVLSNRKSLLGKGLCLRRSQRRPLDGFPNRLQ
jgi:hypothetical protein